MQINIQACEKMLYGILSFAVQVYEQQDHESNNKINSWLEAAP